jgi:RHS repeat-associated protein
MGKYARVTVMHADERGSIIAVSNSTGTSIATNKYDEYGIPASTNLGRFGYTGQTWIAELGMNYYKARMYSPTLGRFLQTDLLGYAYGMNWYDYVGGDPVNFVDPSGLCSFTTWGHFVQTWNSRKGAYNPPRLVSTRVVQDSPCGGALANLFGQDSDPPVDGLGSDGEIVVTASKCGRPSDGPVRFTGVTSTTAAGLIGYTVTDGEFVTGAGGRGRFRSTGYAIGIDVSDVGIVGKASNLGDFTGTSDSLSGGVSILGIPLSGSISKSASSGGTYKSAGSGPGLRFGLSLSESTTRILELHCPSDNAN